MGIVVTSARPRAGDAVAPAPPRISTGWVALGGVSTLIAVVLMLSSVGPHQLDFTVYRSGGIDAFTNHLYTTVVTPRHLLFTYPPFAALLFWPIGHLSAHSGQVGLGLLNCLALFALIGTSMKAALGVRAPRHLWVGACVVMLPAMLLNPVRLTVILGEVNLLIVLMVVTDLTMVLGWRSRVLPRGVLLGIAAAIKLTPLVFIPFLFLTRQFKAGCTALATFAVCSLGTLVLLPKTSWLYWTKEVVDSHRVGSSWFVSNQNLRGALERLTGSTPSSAVLLTLTAAAAVGGLLLSAWLYRRSSPLLGILVCAGTGLVISPISWADHYIWIVPALAWLVLAGDRPQGGRWWGGGALIIFVLAPMFWLPHYLHHYTGPVEYLQGNTFFLALVLFMLATGVLVWRRRGRPTSPSAAPSSREVRAVP
jgi:alpha-1,2-mannosyltransferase